MENKNDPVETNPSLQEPLLPATGAETEEAARASATTRELEHQQETEAPTTPALVDSSTYERQQLQETVEEATESAAGADANETATQEEQVLAAHLLEEPLPDEVLGEEQAPQYRDVGFAYVFVLQLLIVFLTALWLGPQALTASIDDHGGGYPSNSTNRSGYYDSFEWDSVSFLVMSSNSSDSNNTNGDDNDSGNVDGLALGTLLVTTPVLAMALSLGVLELLVRCSNQVVTLSFFATPLGWLVAAGLVGMVEALSPNNDNDNDDTGQWVLPLALLSLAWASALFSALVYCCWRRHVPFAAANLKVALSALRVHMGSMLVVSFATLLALYAFLLVWMLALLGVSHYAAQHGPKVPCNSTAVMDVGRSWLRDDGDDSNDDSPEMCDAQPNAWILVGLLFSFYWTHQVLKNVLHTTTVGAVGSWWFGPSTSTTRAGCCCSQEVWDSWVRATTFSFGSICFGSLVVALLRTLEFLLRENQNGQGRNQNGQGRRSDNNLLGCIVECLVHLIRTVVEYMNIWAFCYVGLYGYDFLTSGKKVVTLFRFRGWTTLVTDRFVFRVLGMMNFAIAILTGGAAVVVDAVCGPVLPDTPAGSHSLAFGIGFLVGLVLSGPIVLVVSSAVRTILVCFAERPAELAHHDPDLYADMIRGWTTVYPDVFQRTTQIIIQEAEEGTIPEATPLVSGAEE